MDRVARDKILDSIPTVITEDQNKELYRCIDEEEVKKATFRLNPDKAPGPDGFPAAFFQSYWGIIGKDLHRVVEESRKRMTMLGAINHTFLALIPKKSYPQKMGDFRPNALCNIIYKIVTKIISNGLKQIINLIIFDEHSVFTPGRSIVEGIITTHETLHFARKSSNACMILKLDILKAYDLMDREFLFEVLDKFGFGDCWIKWIKSCLCTQSSLC